MQKYVQNSEEMTFFAEMMLEEFFERALCCFNKLVPAKEKQNDGKKEARGTSVVSHIMPLDIAELDKTQVDAAFPRFVVSCFSTKCFSKLSYMGV